MNSSTGYLIFQVILMFMATAFTIYLAYIVSDPTRLKAKTSKFKGTPKEALYHKFYNKQFLGAWVCISLFFVSGVVFDIYRSIYTPPTFAVFLMPAVTLATIFAGGTLMSRALKK